MFKKTLLSSVILAVTTGMAVANTAPYVGGGLGLVNNTSSNNGYGHSAYFRGVPFNAVAGYGGVVTQNIYLAGEFFATPGTADISDNNGLKTSYGIGVSILPGLMLSDHTFAFARAGFVRTRFSDAGSMQNGGQVGLGLQTTVTQNIDVRGEYDFTSYGSFNGKINRVSSPNSDAFNVALLYKFE